MAISQIAAGEQISVARPKWNALIDAANAQQYATVAAMAAATSGLASGDVVRVAQGYNSEAEVFRVVASGTFTANNAEVVSLAVSGVQAVSTRMWFTSFADFIADTRTHSTGARLSILGIGEYQAVASSGNLGQTNAGGQEFDVLPFAGGKYHVAAWGVSGTGDESTLVQAAADNIPAGSELHFDGSKTYTLAVDTGNAIFFAPNGATFTNAANDQVILAIRSQVVTTAHTVTEGTLAYGTRQFSVTGASGLFSVGDIGVLHDGKLRPSDSAPVNFFATKIAAIMGDTVTIESPLLSKMSGSIVFRHTAGQMKDAGLIGALHVQPTAGHVAQCVFLQDIDRPRWDLVTGVGTTGVGLTIRDCYDLRGGDADFRDPVSATSGNGYGLQVLNSTAGWFGNTTGRGMRHALDLDSAYDLEFGLVSDSEPAGVPCFLGHNGFAGHLTFRGYRGGATEGVYPVCFNVQGHAAGSPEVDWPLRAVVCGFIDVTCDDSVDVEAFNVLGAYLQGYIEDIDLGTITVHVPDPTTVTDASSSRIVRVNGGLRGVFRAHISCNKIGIPFFTRPDDTVPVEWRTGTWEVAINVADECRRMVWFRNAGNFHLPFAVTTSGLSGTSGVFIESGASGDHIKSLLIGYVDSGHGDTDDERIECGLVVPEGNIPSTVRRTGVRIDFASALDDEITAGQLFNRTGYCRLNVTYNNGGTPHDVNTFPSPQYDGQEVIFSMGGGFEDVAIKASSNVLSDIIISTPGRTRIVAYSGRWVEA